MIDLNAIANGPNEADCAMCKGRGFYGIPGRRCTFCDGSGRVKWRSRRVEDQPLTTTPVVDQKGVNLSDNALGATEVPAIDYVEWKRRYAARLMHHGWNERAAIKEAEYVWAAMEGVEDIPTPEDAADQATADARKEDAPDGVAIPLEGRDGKAF